MGSNVVPFGPRPRKKTAGAASAKETVLSNTDFHKEVDVDINNLCDNLGLERDEAIKMAGDFYRKYPMLMEYVRSQDYLIGGK